MTIDMPMIFDSVSRLIFFGAIEDQDQSFIGLWFAGVVNDEDGTKTCRGSLK